MVLSVGSGNPLFPEHESSGQRAVQTETSAFPYLEKCFVLTSLLFCRGRFTLYMRAFPLKNVTNETV